MRPTSDPWDTSCRVKALFIIVLALLVLFGLVRATEAASGGYCYGASYPATVTAFSSLGLPGWYWVTADTDAGSYTLATTRLFRVGQTRTLQGLVCGGVFSPSRMR